MRKILISPGYGAGWTTWNNNIIQKFMLEYEPIIKFLEEGNSFTRDDVGDWKDPDNIHPLLAELRQTCKDLFNVDYVCILGAEQLQVIEIPDDILIKVDEYDGYESYLLQGDYSGWL